MAKDSYWFRHDSNAGRDLKLLELTHIYTHWAKGVYWDVVEVLREQDGYKFDKSKLQILSSMIMCTDVQKFENWYGDCVRLGLFVEDKTSFWSESLVNRMQKWESSKANGYKGGRPIGSGNKKPNNNPTKTQTKPNVNPTDNPTLTIIEDNIIEDNNKSSKCKYNKYYDEQLKQCNNNKIYEQFIIFLFGKNILERPLNNVLKLKDQISYQRFMVLYDKYKPNTDKIKDTIIALETYKKFNYTSFNGTLSKWLNK